MNPTPGACASGSWGLSHDPFRQWLGGEELLAYMLASDALALSDEQGWYKWRDAMRTRLASMQNADGSWTGQHCITSAVFCTAAGIGVLTADRDAPTLVNIARSLRK